MLRCLKCDRILEIKTLPSGEYLEPCPNCVTKIETEQKEYEKKLESECEAAYKDGIAEGRNQLADETSNFIYNKRTT